MHLQRLKQSGDSVIDTFSECDSLPHPPDGFDMERFTRGRKFFQDNAFSCTFLMLWSLITGLSVNNLLEPLVHTKQSHTPHKALLRYVKTFQHILLWHWGDVWDPSSEAHKSIAKVRQMHNNVRADMMKLENEQTLFITQYDMSLVQCGFMGAIVLYPDSTGIRYSTENLADYCYFWYGIGYLLGISDANNICSGDLTETLGICKEIEGEILLPALAEPPEDFYPMAEALVQGLNLPLRCSLFSLEACLALFYRSISARCPRKLTFVDYLRTLFFRSLLVFVKYVPYVRSLFDRMIMSLLPKPSVKNE